MSDSDDQGRAACAVEIKKALRRGPTGDLLQKHVMVESGRLRKNAARRLADQVKLALTKVGLVVADEPAGVGQCSLNTIRKLHDDGPRLMTPDGEWLRKVSLPSQSSNARNDSTRADDGASLGTQLQTLPGAKPTRLGPAHASSLSDGKPPPEDSDMDETTKALKRIHAAGPQRGP
jgi:hypothetical protein